MDIVSYENEIEYFKCLPFAFTTELLTDLESLLIQIFKDCKLHSKLQTPILESFKKNIFIFNNFVLRNILKFPQNFNLERKVTDKVVSGNAANAIKILTYKQNALRDLNEYLIEIKEKEMFLINKRNGYINLLSNYDKLRETTMGVKEIKSFLKETMGLYDKYRISTSAKEQEFEKLMEYKNIKSEYYKNERNSLLKIADYESLENLKNSL